MSAKKERFGWGVWLVTTNSWAELPSRLCKPTPHNSDLNSALLDVVRQADAEGQNPEIKRIPARTLKTMRANHR